MRNVEILKKIENLNRYWLAYGGLSPLLPTLIVTVLSPPPGGPPRRLLHLDLRHLTLSSPQVVCPKYL